MQGPDLRCERYAAPAGGGSAAPPRVSSPSREHAARAPFRAPSASDDERALLARLAAGDEAAYDSLFRAWYAPLVRATTAIVRERAVAEELVQDVMLELWRRRATLDIEGSAQGYLFRAARNRALNHLRNAKVRYRAAEWAEHREADEPCAPRQLAADELEAATREAIAALPPRCREVFEMSRVGGLRYAEIADALGVSIKAVEANMSRALRALRVSLAPWLPDRDRP